MIHLLPDFTTPNILYKGREISKVRDVQSRCKNTSIICPLSIWELKVWNESIVTKPLLILSHHRQPVKTQRTRASSIQREVRGAMPCCFIPLDSSNSISTNYLHHTNSSMIRGMKETAVLYLKWSLWMRDYFVWVTR